MRIGFFTSIEGWGGSELYLLGMAEAVSESGHEPVVIGPAGTRMEQECRRRRIPFVAWKDRSEARGIVHHPAGMTRVLPLSVRLLLGNLREALALRSILRRVGPDVMHINVHGYEMAGFACLLSGIPCVGVYATSPVNEMNRTRRWLIKTTMRTYDRLVTKSRASAQAWSSAAGVSEVRFAVIWNDVDVVRFTPGPSGQEPAVRGGLRLVSVGRLHPMKGYRHVIEAVASLRDCDVTLTIAGEGELHSELSDLAERLGIGRRVRLIGHVEDVVPLLRESDAFVLASVSHESFPSAVAQAMACGLPVVTSDYGPLKEINRHGVTGLVVPVGDSAALAAAIRELAVDRARRMTMGQVAREHAVKSFGSGAMVRQTFGVYEALWANRHGPATRGTGPLRIGFFTSIEGWGGSESYLLELMAGIRNKGHVPILFGVGGSRLVRDARLAGIEVVEWKTVGVSPWEGGKASQHGLPVRVLVASVPSWLKLLAGVVREIGVVRGALRLHLVDVLHVSVNGYEVASFAAWLEGIPSLAMCMTSPAGETSRVRRGLIRWGLRCSTLVSAQSRTCAREWMRQEGLDARHVSFVWNGVDTGRFAAGQTVLPRNPGDPFRLVSVGRLHPMKGHHVLVEAMRILGDERVFLQIVGEGGQEAALRGQIEGAGLGLNVQVTGHSEHPEELLWQAHCFVLASVSHESGPAVVAEAMAAGLPVITSDFGSLAEMNIDGVTGIVARAGDASALAQTIRWMADNPGICVKMGRVGKEHAARYFTRERMVERTINIYRDVMRSATGGCACGAGT